MARRMLAVMALLAVGCVLGRAADVEKSPADPAKPADAPSETVKDLTLKKEIDARNFREMQHSLLRLAQRLENSSTPEDRERAANIRKAIDLASSSGVDTRFEKLIGILQTSKDINLSEVESAMAENAALVADLRAILALLRSDNRDDQLRAEKLRLLDLLKQLDRVIRDEKLNRARVEGGRVEKRDLIEAERKNRKNTQELGRALGRDKKDAKDSKGDLKDHKSQAKGEGKGKDSKGESKESKGEAKGEGKSGGKGEKSQAKGKGKGDSKSAEGDAKGEGSEDSPSKSDKDAGKPADSVPGKRQIQDAQEHQQRAEDEIEKEEKETASQEQSKAIEELEKARKKLEEILRQLREEEIERLLAALQARCERMLSMQIEVYNGTVQVDKAFAENPSKNRDDESNRGNVQKSIDLSKREFQIVEEANKAIALLEAEGSAVAFPEMFVQVRDDMKHVERRLGKSDTGAVTQVIETDIISNLKDMIEALKKAQQEQQAKKGNGGGGGKPQDQKLIDLLAELKMIRSMEVRVKARTETYAAQYTGEQALVPDIRKELVDLADRQKKIFDVTNDIYRGKNK